jgi:hypothetical protein
MSKIRLLLSFVLFAGTFAVCLSAVHAQPYCGAGYGPGVMGFLTPEQRMMHFSEVQNATAGKDSDAIWAYRSGLRSKVMAMSQDERRKFADTLSVHWTALSPEEKAKIQQDFFAYRGPGRGTGMGRGRGRGAGCWW